MSQVFHEIEKKIIRLLNDNPKLSPEKIGISTGLTPDQVRRGIEWLKLKNLANIEESILKVEKSIPKVETNKTVKFSNTLNPPKTNLP